jgi:hypothetical protein
MDFDDVFNRWNNRASGLLRLAAGAGDRRDCDLTGGDAVASYVAAESVRAWHSRPG